jgi:hypothetical protein
MRYNVPQDDRRGCLCRDGTYSTKCCGGDYYNQGIGNTIYSVPVASGLTIVVNTRDAEATTTFTIGKIQPEWNYSLEVSLSSDFDGIDDVTTTGACDSLNLSVVQMELGSGLVHYARVRFIRPSDDRTTEWSETATSTFV